LHAGAVLEYLPEQIIPFAQAAFQQHMTVRLGPGACILAMEIVAPGRLARGEAFAYRDYDSSVCIEAAPGQVLLRERTRLRPGCQRLDRPGYSRAITISARSMRWSRGGPYRQISRSICIHYSPVVQGSWAVPPCWRMVA
jgi:urease accessory protein